MHSQSADVKELRMLKNTDLSLADHRQDVRDRTVIDNDGKHIGHISGLFVDEDERKVRMLEVSGGGFLGVGDQLFLIPVESITKVNLTYVWVDESAAHVAMSPAYDPKLIVKHDHDFWKPYYGYYGRTPYWVDGYAYPEYDDWFNR